MYFCPGVQLEACVRCVMHSSPGCPAGCSDRFSSHAEHNNCNQASQEVTPPVWVFLAAASFAWPPLLMQESHGATALMQFCLPICCWLLLKFFFFSLNKPLMEDFHSGGSRGIDAKLRQRRVAAPFPPPDCLFSEERT